MRVHQNLMTPVCGPVLTPFLDSRVRRLRQLPASREREAANLFLELLKPLLMHCLLYASELQMSRNFNVSKTQIFFITSRTRSHCRTTHGPGRRRAYLRITAKAVVGIDLGTCNSAVAAILDGHAHVIEGVDGAVTPSCVAVLQVCGSAPGCVKLLTKVLWEPNARYV